MARPIIDPYVTLGVSPGASDAELRAAYRRLVKLHHPDHNNGSAESARAFEEVQEAYARIAELRASGARGSGDAGGRISGGTSRPADGASHTSGASRPAGGARAAAGGAGRGSGGDPDLEARIAELERELREARAARDEAHEAAREAARQAAAAARAAQAEAAGVDAGTRRPTDEELGYVSTDDSISRILADARAELSSLFSDAREQPAVKRLGGLLDNLASKLTDRDWFRT